MKKFFIILFSLVLFLSTNFALADDVDLPASGDLWDNFSTTQDFYGQDKKGVSDEEFDKAIEQIKDKQNRNFFGFKKKNKNIPKGEEFSQSNETEILETEVNKDTLPVLSLPVELVVGEGILPVGHYQVQGEVEEDKYYLNLYQAHNLFAKLPAIETKDDFGEESILFARWFAHGENKIKIIYGSLDFNAYAIVEIKE